MFYPTQEAFEWLNREALLVLEQGKTYETTQEFFRKDGAGLFIRCIGKAIDPSNTSGGVLWVYEDVTEKRQAEKTLHKERHLLQTIIDNAKNSHLAYLDRDFNFFCVNNAYASTMGNRPEEMIGLNLFEFYPNEKNKAICSQVRDMGEPIEAVDMPFEFPGQVNRGTTYWDWTLAPVKDSAGQVEGLVLSLFETTARKRAEQEMARLLEQTEKDAAIKGQLLREINHRVINNLIALRGLLLVEKRGTPKEGRLWTNIALDRVSDRVQGMLAAHELLSNFEWAPMPVADLARKIIGQIFKTCSAEERVFIEVSNARSMVSPRQVNSLALILNELATNTIKYGTTKRRRTNISVQTEEDGDFLILRYRDDGPGYPEQILAGERANVGLALINDLAEGSLGGNLTISNDKGSVAEIRIRKEPLSHT
jgi:PAS domain S-box-containing protein